MQWLINAKKKDTKLPVILQAAVRLFVKQGVEATTTKQIAEEAGVAEGTLYRHFKAKDEMAYNVFVTHLEEFTKELQAALANQPTLERKLHALVTTYFHFFETERDLFEYIVIAEHREFKKYPETKIHPGTVIVSLIEDAIEKKEIPAQDVVLSSAFLVGILHRVSVYRIYKRLQESLTRHIEDVTKACLKVLQ